ncbi:MAG TPA: hypothetical protein VIK06_06550 [Candidatus Limnocylindrales bacterium]
MSNTDPEIQAAVDLFSAETPFTIEFDRIAKAIGSLPSTSGAESDEQARAALAEWWETLTADQKQAVSDEYHEKWIAAAHLHSLADLGAMRLLPAAARDS